MALPPVTRVLTRLDTQQGGKSANRFPLSLESAMIRTMKTILKTLILAPGLAWAAEQLPDTAPPDDAAPQTREKGPAHPMDALYLQSPVELDTSDENRGLNALSAEARYLENEQQEMRQRQAETVRPATVPENTPPPAPPNLIPIRDL